MLNQQPISIRQTTPLEPSLVHVVDDECSAAAFYVRSKGNRIGAEELHALKTNVSPNCITHIVNVEGDPNQFFFDTYDRDCLYANGADFQGKLIHEVCDPGTANGILDTYDAVRRGQDRLSRVIILSNPSRAFFCFATPLIENGQIKQILVCSRYQKIISQRQIVPDKFSIACQKIERLIATVAGALAPTVLARYARWYYPLAVNGLESIYIRRNPFINNLLEGIGEYPISTIFESNGLSISG